MGEGELFGEVRAVVHGANTHIGWSDLCLLLEGSDPESYRSRLEPYLSEMLASWSDEVRVVPVRWLAAACAGEPTPWLGLARHLYVSKDILEACATPRRRGNWRDSAERRGARLLSALEQLRGVTVLDIEGEWPDGYHFETLCASEVFDGVRSLTVEHVRHDGQGTLDVTPFAAFQGSPLSHGIERLDVALGVSSGRLLEGWACGLSGGGFETLRSLALDGSTERLAYLLEELMRAPGLDGLTSFSWAAFADLSRDVEVLPTDMPNLESLRFAFTRGRYEGDHVARVERVVRMLEACGASRLRTLELDRVNLREGRVEGVLGALGPDTRSRSCASRTATSTPRRRERSPSSRGSARSARSTCRASCSATTPPSRSRTPAPSLRSNASRFGATTSARTATTRSSARPASPSRPPLT